MDTPSCTLTPLETDHLKAWSGAHGFLGATPENPRMIGLLGDPVPPLSEAAPSEFAHLWEVSSNALLEHFTLRAKPFRSILYGAFRTLAVSRFGSFFRILAPQAAEASVDPWELMNISPTKIVTDLFLVSLFASDQLDAIAHQQADLRGQVMDFTDALGSHLDLAAIQARERVLNEFDLLPLPGRLTNTLFYEEPLDTSWISLVLPDEAMPKCLKSAYLFHPANGILLAGQVPSENAPESCMRLWWEAAALTQHLTMGNPVGLVLHSQNYALLLDPCPSGEAVLATTWYLASPLSTIQAATLRLASAASRSLRDG